MADESGVLGYESLNHVERRDRADHPAPVDAPLIGLHDKAADEKATAVYFRKKQAAIEYAVADLVDLAAEKQKRMDCIREIAEIGQEYGLYDNGFATKDSGHAETCWTQDANDPENFEYNLKMVYSNAKDLCIKKHKDYGPKNISLSPGGPLNGLRVRMWDKFARINNLVDAGATPENESLRDSFVDMLNYAAIAIMVLDGNWPNE